MKDGMKTHYTDEMVDALVAGAELDALAALGMGYIDGDGLFARNGARCPLDHALRHFWHPSSKRDGWRDAGRLLDEAKRLKMVPLLHEPPKCEGTWVAALWPDGWEYERQASAKAPTGPLAITKAFVKARLPEINAALAGSQQ